MSSLGVLLLLALANLAFGAGYPFVKAIVIHIEPAQWIFMRAVFSTGLLAIYARRDLMDSALTLRDILWLAFASLFGVIINQICFVEGLKRSLPAHAAMINAAVPLLTLLFGAILLREALSWRKIAGIILGITGIIYLLGLGSLSRINPFFKGDLLNLANAASYSLYLVIARFALTHIKPAVALTWMTAFGIVGFGIYADWGFPLEKLPHLPVRVLGFMVYLIIVSSVIAYVIYLWALKRVEASQSALFCYLQPVSSGILAYLLLGDMPEERFYISAGLILAGILVGNLRSRA